MPRPTFNVSVQLGETSQSIQHEAINAYTKGPLYCVYATDGLVYKYPVVHLFRVVEEYARDYHPTPGGITP